MSDYILNSKEKLLEVLAGEKELYLPVDKNSFEYKKRNPFKHKMYMYLKYLRKYEYMCYKRDSSSNMILSKIYSQRIKLMDIKMKNLGLKINVEIKPGCVGENVRICHPNVILNGIVGKNCVFHGNNVLGNKSSPEKNKTPRLGSNIDVGIGAIIIGDVEIADNCVIGSGAVVTKSFTTPGSVIAGVPARLIK